VKINKIIGENNKYYLVDKIYKTCKLKSEGDKVQNEKKYSLLETCRRY